MDEKNVNNKKYCTKDSTSTILDRWNAIWEIIKSRENNALSYYEKFLDSVQKTKYLCLFGAGNAGESYKADLNRQGMTVDFYCDNDMKKWGTKINGVPCISPSELELLLEQVTILISTQYCREIHEQLSLLGFGNIYHLPGFLFEQKEKIINNSILLNEALWRNGFSTWADEKSKLVYTKRLEALISTPSIDFWDEIICPVDNQYFEPEIINLDKNEVFVDAGAFTGDTLLSFINHTNGEFDKVICFEFDPENYKKLQDTVSTLPKSLSEKIECLPKGLYSTYNTFSILPIGASSTINKTLCNGGSTVYVVPLDEVVSNQVTFIKMDIEGAELEALRGASALIKKYRPILAICVYHKVEDILEIPSLINNLVPDYKFYLRHYTQIDTETVCYAIPLERT